jgi:hypothetical protein
MRTNTPSTFQSAKTWSKASPCVIGYGRDAETIAFASKSSSTVIYSIPLASITHNVLTDCISTGNSKDSELKPWFVEMAKTLQGSKNSGKFLPRWHAIDERQSFIEVQVQLYKNNKVSDQLFVSRKNYNL